MRHLLVLFALLSATAHADNPPSWKDDLKLSALMRKAAYEYASVKAQEKSVEATRDQRKATLLNSITVSANIGKSGSHTQIETQGLELKGRDSNVSRGVSVQFLASLSTWMQARGLQITAEMQEAALKGLQIQLASDATVAYLNFTNASSRIGLLKAVCDSLQKIVAKVGSGEKTLNDVNKTLLVSRVNEIEGLLAAARFQKEQAGADLARFLGVEPDKIPYHSDWEPSGERGESGFASNDWKGIDYEKLDNYFSVPGTVDEAFTQAMQSPTMVQARLAEDAARNTWYLTWSSMAPALVLIFNKSTGFNDDFVTGYDRETRGATVSVGLSMSISGGIYHRLSAAKLLEEAAQLSSQATLAQLRSGLYKAYSSMAYTRRQVQLYEQALKSTFEGMVALKTVTDENTQQYLSLLSGLDLSTQQLVAQMTAYVSTRMQVHNLMGTLLAQIDRLQGMGE